MVGIKFSGVCAITLQKHQHSLHTTPFFPVNSCHHSM